MLSCPAATECCPQTAERRPAGQTRTAEALSPPHIAPHQGGRHIASAGAGRNEAVDKCKPGYSVCGPT